MVALTFPFWILFAILSPVIFLFFILGFSSAVQMQKKISEKPPIGREAPHQQAIVQQLRLPS
jgi:uncharacterized protein YneF (UPF0154 family)